MTRVKPSFAVFCCFSAVFQPFLFLVLHGIMDYGLCLNTVFALTVFTTQHGQNGEFMFLHVKTHKYESPER
jgi:hypothetical protein